MNKPWIVQIYVGALIEKKVPFQDFEAELMRILEFDDPGGFWLDGERETNRATLDSLGIAWDEIKDIFEEEINEYARLHAAEYEQDKKARDLP